MRRSHGLALATAALILAAGAGTGQEPHPQGQPRSRVRVPLPSAQEIAKLPPDGGPEFNRLVFEQSPYLLQHARNPVDWHPWGQAAFARAEKEGKPILLSIGYSTCHWCHVMEHESFEDEGIARFINEHFVAIKVDREERPDVDAVYMEALLASTGRGGWPMTIFLTPERKPFWCGTYLPPEDRFGRPGFRSLLERMVKLWKEERETLAKGAEALTSYVQNQAVARAGVALTEETLGDAVAEFRASFDAAHGGFGAAPKFPRSHGLTYLLRWWKRTGDQQVLGMVTTTLDHLARGGIRDHLGGGFHRYSTDREWLVPHFEKMLYDQAMLGRVFAEAWQATGNAEYAAVARATCEYVLRKLAHPRGGFFAAEDADSEGVEGKFYVWERKEILAVLGPERGEAACRLFQVTGEGNYADELTREKTGLNILHLRRPGPGGAAEALEVPPAIRNALFEAREKRVHPGLDDKVLADWNGLMIGTLAYAGRTLPEPRYVEAARRAATFLLSEMRRDGRLLHVWRQGRATVPAYLDDHAFLGLGLLDLYEATFDVRWLQEAVTLADRMLELFHDQDQGGFHFVGHDGEVLVARTKDLYDGAMPSGNSGAALFLLRLGRMTVREGFETTARGTLEAFSAEIARSPTLFPAALMALDFAIGPTQEIVLAGKPEDPLLQQMRLRVDRAFLPRSVLLFHPPGPAGEVVRALVPFVAEQVAIDGKATAYVCHGHACELPITDPEQLKLGND